MNNDKDNYRQMRERLEQLGFPQQQSYEMLRAIEPAEEKDDLRLVSDFYDGCREIIRRACHQRCPDDGGHKPMCQSCMIQHIFNLLFTHVRMKAEDFQKKGALVPAFHALAWLVLEEHKPENFCW